MIIIIIIIMFGMWYFGVWDVGDVGCSGCRIFGMWNVWDVKYLSRCGMLIYVMPFLYPSKLGGVSPDFLIAALSDLALLF